MRRAAVLPILAALPLLAAPGTGANGPASTAPDEAEAIADTIPRPPADHHLHVWSADAVDALLRIQEAIDQQVIDPEKARPLGAEEAIAALDSAGVRRGVLLSNAYFFGSPDVDFEDERAKVRAENAYVAEQVRRRPERLVGFCSVNPTAGYVPDVLDRCERTPELVGLKLHLANSDVSLRDSADLARLADVFEGANRRGLAIVIHLRNRVEDYGRRDVENFVERVLPAAPDVPVQVAHLGGSGGYDARTGAAVEAFAGALRDHPERTSNLLFDLAAAPVPPHRARGDSALLERVRAINEAAARGIRALGPDRIVYGSDWPAASGRYLEGIRSALPLADSLAAELLDDPAPYLP